MSAKTRTMADDTKLAEPTEKEKQTKKDMSQQVKTLGNTTASKAKDNIKDLVVFGDGDMFKLLSKASSKKEGWMKSTKAMEIPKIGVVIQVTTQQGGQVAEALVFVPGAQVAETEVDGVVIARAVINDARIV